jgi:hypothetical protein
MAIKYATNLPSQDPPKFTQIWIFGLKIYHLATLLGSSHAKLVFLIALVSMYNGIRRIDFSNKEFFIQIKCMYVCMYVCTGDCCDDDDEQLLACLSFEYTGSCNVIYPRNKLWANSYIWSTRI